MADKILKYCGPFNVIHAHDWLTYLTAIEIKRRTGKPLVAHVHSTEFDRSGKHASPNIFDIEQQGITSADHVVAVSNVTRSVVIAKYGQDPCKVTTIHNASEQYRRNTTEYPAVRQELIVTFLGRVTFQKGPAYFVEAAHKVLQQRTDVRFVLAGDGDLLGEVKDLATRLGIFYRFSFPGFVGEAEIQKLFDRSTIYVMPSVSEPFGITALEAISAAVPVIISRQAGVAEILENVIKIDYWDTTSVANAILELLENPALADSLRAAAAQELEKFTWMGAAAKLALVYDSVVRGG